MVPIFMCGVKIQMPTTYSVGKEILSRLIRTRVQKCTYFELLIENRRDMFLKVVGFLLKIVNIRKNNLKKSQQLFN